MDQVTLFRAFLRVAESASFTRAADTLGMPRSSVSAAVRELEGRVGARLLHRTTRNVRMTQEGRIFHAHCTRLVAEMEAMEGLFRPQDSPHGRLTVDVPGRLGRLIVAPALPHFLDRYPGIDLVLGVTDRAVNLVEDNVDCALRVGPLADSAMVARRVGELRFINVASPVYLARFGTPQSPAELTGHQGVLFASPTTGRVEDWEWEEGGTLRRLAIPGRVTVNSAEAQIACCLAGLGLIQIPAYDVRAYLAAGELAEVMPGHVAAPLPVTLLHPDRHHVPARLRVFMDWMTALLRAEVVD
ncbi:LysR family transcriptional regulator [Sphingomonas koreensis]|uniref:LysR family transcriptional regulator n=1 Tax=Sphingomonas koreensis TaxID=93064 RepID=A0A430G186_9SPHN|nr:LysR family transcriptional regulator [Sphingomonas koreensis]RSY81443.1 LysR family transcriptional regulator [Sphingomonas koreensis]